MMRRSFSGPLVHTNGLGVLVVLGEVVQPELLELAFRSAHALRQNLFAQDAEEAFDHVHPGGMRGCVMEMHPGMSSHAALCLYAAPVKKRTGDANVIFSSCTAFC